MWWCEHIIDSDISYLVSAGSARRPMLPWRCPFHCPAAPEPPASSSVGRFGSTTVAIPFGDMLRRGVLKYSIGRKWPYARNTSSPTYWVWLQQTSSFKPRLSFPASSLLFVVNAADFHMGELRSLFPLSISSVPKHKVFRKQAGRAGFFDSESCSSGGRNNKVNRKIFDFFICKLLSFKYVIMGNNRNNG